ncbi:MAG: CHAD domain-containing protein [Methanocalculus sp. MSAO_Arc2]|uniref:CHAD domain-containing protein n=1 Tax=Methanocalculus sp. MSAO_Arc2 TaxID=2293855 RepID=UPI000FEF4E95|nr:MAG: CHAD domain-containing protein [Methanocalculus sp. MSAO_Arc2]
MAGDKSHKHDEGFCLYGAQVLRKLTEEIMAEADGVKISDDIEYIHRMRVASRRIRAALPLFAPCFTPVMYKRLRKGVRSITRSLGAARDLDVQIDFLNEYLDTLPQEHPPVWYAGFLPPEGGSSATRKEAPVIESVDISVDRSGPVQWVSLLFSRIRMYLTRRSIPSVLPGPSSFEPPIRTGIECLLLRWTEKRSALHPGVVSSVDAFEQSRIADELLDWCRETIVHAHLHRTDTHTRWAYEAAYRAISLRLEELFSYERFIHDPARISEHHDMRIAAKRLRYTLEIFNDLYSGTLKKPIQEIKHLQDILGDMHDCDVWLDVLNDFLQEEEDRVRAFFGNSGFMVFIRPGILNLEADRKSRRDVLYTSFVHQWNAMKEGGVFNSIRQSIAAPFAIGSLSLQGEDKPLRIALIGDIHANLPALRAVISDAEQRGATHILHLGDIIGFGPFPEETVRVIREKEIIGVAGNIDCDILSLTKKECGKKVVGDDEKSITLCWTRKQLSKESRRYLGSLQREIRITVNGSTLLLTHGSPGSIQGRLGPETSGAELLDYAQAAQADVVVSAHTHIPWTQTLNNCLFINTGSVGRPADRDPRACYCVLETAPLSVCHIRIPYDIEAVTGAMEDAGLPPAISRMFRHGIGLDEARILSEDDSRNMEKGSTLVSCTVDRILPE